jgi:hypothetical protein
MRGSHRHKSALFVFSLENMQKHDIDKIVYIGQSII